MTDKELLAHEYAIENWEYYEEGQSDFEALKQAVLYGLEAGKGEYSKIYMLGRKDERERPCSLCKNPINICERCERRKHCEGSDTGAYVSVCEDFIYKDVKE